MLKTTLIASLACLLSMFLIGCTTPAHPTKEEQCAGLQRKITYNKNNNSYDTDMLKSRRSSMEQQYQALNCGNNQVSQ